MSAREPGIGERLALRALASNRNPRFAFGSMAGRFILLVALRKSDSVTAQAAIADMARLPLDETGRVAALVSADPAGEAAPALVDLGVRRLIFWDPTGEALAAWGLDQAGEADGFCLLLDPSLRVVHLWPLRDHARAYDAFLALPEPDAHAGAPLTAPVLIAPRVFEPAFCVELIKGYRANGALPSGTTKENEQGRTYVSLDPSFKQRRDWVIEDAALREAAMHRIYWRLIPEIEKAFAFRCTRMERYIVSCYDSETGGYFKPHRDNTTKGTAHRRFAVTINLNAEEYDGGDLRFPEFGARRYRAPTGGAVVFSCSLLHEATPVTRGARYAFLPFLYDEAAAQLRAENLPFLDQSLRG